MRALSVILLLAAFPLLSSCLSYEFQATEYYHQFRNDRVEEVRLIYHEPLRPVRILGVMEVRDVVDIFDPSFQGYVRRIARKKGAEGAWVLYGKEKKRVMEQSWKDCFQGTPRRQSMTHVPLPVCIPQRHEITIIPVILFVERK